MKKSRSCPFDLRRTAALASLILQCPKASVAFLSSRMQQRKTTVALMVFSHQRAQQQQQAFDSRPVENPSLLSDVPLCGGDYAGLSATFSPTTGDLIPVPEHLIPESLVEWGQVPSCLEVLVSEDVAAPKLQQENNDDTAAAALTRRTVTILPDVGCGVDNLDTMKTEEEILLLAGSLHAWDTTTAVALDTANEKDARARLETVFAVALPTEELSHSQQQQQQQRMRVLVHVTQRRHHEKDRIEIQSPITLILERKISETSSQGTIADGGGLDGRTVAELLGDALRRKPFSDVIPNEPRVVSAKDDDTTTSVQFPGNITLSYNKCTSSTTSTITSGDLNDEWILEIRQGARNEQQVVRRRFRRGAVLQAVDVEHWTETDRLCKEQ